MISNFTWYSSTLFFSPSSFPSFVPFLHLTKCFFTPVSAAIESFFRHFLCSPRKPSWKNPLAAVHPRHGSDPELSASPAHEKTEREANERVQKKLILPGLEKIRSWHASSSSSLNRLTASQINPVYSFAMSVYSFIPWFPKVMNKLQRGWTC